MQIPFGFVVSDRKVAGTVPTLGTCIFKAHASTDGTARLVRTVRLGRLGVCINRPSRRHASKFSERS